MVEWKISDGLTDYETAVQVMEQRAIAIADGTADELIWLLEHPPYIPRAHPPRWTICSIRIGFLSIPANAGGSIRTTGPGNGLSM